MRFPLGFRLDRGLSRAVASASTLLLIATFAGCKAPDGISPPPETLVFPIAATLSPYDRVAAEAPSHIFVANSNFDISYNSGSLQSYDLDVAVAAMTDVCCTLGAGPCVDGDGEDREPVDAADCQIIPAGTPFVSSDTGVDPIQIPNAEIALPLIVDEVLIGSYADGISISSDGGRLYLPVRSDADITHVDVDVPTGQMNCGEGFGASGDSCADAFRTTDHTLADARDEELPTDPVAIYAAPLSDLMGAGEVGNFLIMTHRVGQASLFIDADPTNGSRPALIDVMSGLPGQLVTSRWDPYQQVLWNTSQASGFLGRVGVTLDGFSTAPADGRLFNAGSLVVTGIDSAGASPDTRDIAFDPRAGHDEIYVLSRRPPSIIRGIDEGEDLLLQPSGIVDIGEGPSRLALETFDVGGETRLLAFASCFDSRDLYIVDLDTNLLLSVVRGMSGPFELSIDPVRRLIYVVDFNTSVIRFVDLSPMIDCLLNPPTDDEPRSCQASVVGMIGQPEAARQTK